MMPFFLYLINIHMTYEYYTHKLMIKTHNVTGLKYLCYSKKNLDDLSHYNGSGQAWLIHLEKYGYDITTEIIFSSDDEQEFKEYARNKSKELDVKLSESWANMRDETGTGGDTVSDKMWITNGTITKYILKSQDIPAGWRKGRSNCVFNDPEKQRKFGMMTDYIKRGKAIKEGQRNSEKFKNRKLRDISGDKNPTKCSNVRKKISDAAKKRWAK